MSEAARFEIRASGLLRAHDLVSFLDERGYEAQRDAHHHAELMHRKMKLFQRTEQRLHRVRELKRRGGVGQQQRAAYQQQYTQYQKSRRLKSLEIYADSPDFYQQMLALGIKQVEYARNYDYKDYGLRSAQQYGKPYPAQYHAYRKEGQHHGVGPYALGNEQNYYIQQGQHELRPRIKAVDDGISGEILPHCDILKHPCLSP